MRQRITFFHRPQSAVDPALLRLANSRLAGPSVDAAREDRVTLGLDELPAELAQLLGDGVHELHVHWAGALATEPVSPLLARLPPGLHVFYTPQNASGPTTLNICPLLQKIFGPSLDCQSLDTSFTALSGDRFSHSAAFQYYAPLASLSGFADYATSEWCSPRSSGGPASCGFRVDQLDSASGLDLSYDAISHTLKVATVWPLEERPLDVTAVPGGRTEVGILAADSPPNLGPYDLGMAGHVAVLGQDSKPSPVLFAFPSRHRQDDGASFSATFLEPTGLHPTLQLRIASGLPPRSDGSIDIDNDGEETSSSSCKLHAYLTLPRHIFADKYQLSNPLFLASKNLTALRHMTQPVDLEAPDYAVPVWGSAVLLELAPPSVGQKQKHIWTAEVPLHLRYLQPAAGGYQNAGVPYPVVFWACAAEEGTKFSTNPFDQANLGYDGLFGPRTEFWHVDARPQDTPLSHASPSNYLVNTIRVPVLDASKAKWVGPGTAIAILLGFGWVLWKLLGVYLQAGYGRVPAPTGAAKEKKTQ